MFKLRKVQYTITYTTKLSSLVVPWHGRSACSLPQEVRLRAKSKNFQGLVFALNRD